MSKFSRYSCEVRLGGDTHHQHPLRCVTAPEIIVLRAIHGNDAVVNIEDMGNEIFPKERERGASEPWWKIGEDDAQEFDRLRQKYDRGQVNDVNPAKTPVAHLWPGFNPVLPAELPELALKSRPVGRPRKNKEPSEATELAEA